MLLIPLDHFLFPALLFLSLPSHLNLLELYDGQFEVFLKRPKQLATFFSFLAGLRQKQIYTHVNKTEQIAQGAIAQIGSGRIHQNLDETVPSTLVFGFFTSKPRKHFHCGGFIVTFLSALPFAQTKVIPLVRET